MIVSARTIFKIGHTGWDEYSAWIKLPKLEEVRTIDSGLNKFIKNCGNIECDKTNMFSALTMLPKISTINEYYLLAVKDSEENIENIGDDKKIIFLGCDLADSTRTSSLLNCGPWEGSLSTFNKKRNKYGLLNLDDARASQALLPRHWGKGDSHAHVDIYNLFELGQ